jgi:uncharacterized membrane protein YjjB (DUF3815 family)
MILTEILADGFFAAIAAIGFGAISDPPTKAFPYIAILGAVGHAMRFVLMNYAGFDIATASFCGSLLIGFSSLWFGEKIRCPMTVLYIPALLPMIPGMYAYRSVFSLIMFMQNLVDPVLSESYMNTMLLNIVVTVSVIFTLAVGATIPIFIFKERAYSMTRGAYTYKAKTNE